MTDTIDIEINNAVPKYMKNLSDPTFKFDCLRGPDSVVYTRLPSSTQSLNSQYVIRLNESQAISAYLEEEGTYNLNFSYNITQPAANSSTQVYTFTLATPAYPSFSFNNAIANSYNTQLGSQSFVSPNVSRLLTPLAIRGLNSDVSKFDVYGASQIEAFARPPMYTAGGATEPGFNFKYNSIKSPSSAFSNSTDTYHGNLNDPWNELLATITIADATPGAAGYSWAAPTITNVSWQYITFTCALTKAAAPFATDLNTTINVTLSFTCSGPIINGIFSSEYNTEKCLGNLSTIIIQKNAVPNPLEQMNIVVKPITTAIAVGQATPLNVTAATSAANVQFTFLTLSLTMKETPNLIYKTLTFNDRSVIPSSINILAKDWNIMQMQPFTGPIKAFNPNATLLSQAVLFQSQTMSLPIVPSAIVIYVCQDPQNLRWGTNSNFTKLPQLITNFSQISLGGRSIQSGLVTPDLVHRNLMRGTHKALNDLGICHFGSSNLGYSTVGLCGSVVCLTPADFGLSADQCQGMLETQNLQLQFNMNVANLDELQNADIPGNTFTVFILAITDRLITMSRDGGVSNTQVFFNKSQLSEIRNAPPLFVDTNKISMIGGMQLAGAWYDDVGNFFKSAASKAMDGLSWAADSLPKVISTAEKIAPLLGLGEDERDQYGGRRVDKREEMKRLLRR